MSYTPPDPLNIKLQFTTEYTIPSPGTIFSLYFGSLADADITPEPSEIKLYGNSLKVSVLEEISTAKTQIYINTNKSLLEYAYVLKTEPSQITITAEKQNIEPLPEIISTKTKTGIFADTQNISGAQENDLPVKIGTGKISAYWKADIDHTDKKEIINWYSPEKTETHKKIYRENKKHSDKTLKVDFLDSINQYNIQTKNFGTELKKYTNSIRETSFVITPRKDTQKNIPVPLSQKHPYALISKTIKNMQKDKTAYRNRHITSKKDNKRTTSSNIESYFRKTGTPDTQHSSYHGPYWYHLWCGETYYPYRAGEKVELVLRTDVPFSKKISFITPNNPRCPFDYWYSGNRDNFDPDIKPIDTKITPVKKVYYMLNSAFIKRLPSSEDIPFQSVSISIDRSSWTWDFNITLLSKESLNLIKPSGSTLIDIEININGWKWTCRVENWSESISFGQKTWTVSGRSPSVELGEPYMVEPSFSNTEAHGGQIINNILQNTGWTADWSSEDFNPYTDWLIPQSTINMYDSSKIQQIQTIVEAVNAFIITVPDTNQKQQFIIKPKYKLNPWKWNTEIVPSVILNQSVCSETGRQNTIIKPINAVIVTSENKGVILSATKDGTAGDKPAPMEVNSLMTTKDAAQEKARHIIGNSGFWINHSMNLFSLMPPGQAPGLLLPGDYIKMEETGTSAWTGQITGVDITASWGTGLDVQQQIEVEQFYG